MEKLIALPTINKNEGKTRSVGVRPFQRECISGANGGALPLLLTIIIKQTVIPRNISSDKKRDDRLLMVEKLSIYVKKELLINLCPWVRFLLLSDDTTNPFQANNLSSG